MTGLSINGRFVLAVVTATGTACTVGCEPLNKGAASGSAEQEITLNIGNPAASEDVPLEELPVVRVDKASKMPIQFYVANSSSKPVGYWKDWLGMSHTWYWELVNSETGKRIPRIEVLAAVPTQDRIRILAPAESVLCEIIPRDALWGIPEGRYEFHVHYSVNENGVLAELGCVPDEFDRTIMLIDLVEGQSVFASLWFWMAAGCVLVLLAWCWWHRRRKGGASNESPCE